MESRVIKNHDAHFFTWSIIFVQNLFIENSYNISFHFTKHQNFFLNFERLQLHKVFRLFIFIDFSMKWKTTHKYIFHFTIRFYSNSYFNLKRCYWNWIQFVCFVLFIFHIPHTVFDPIDKDLGHELDVEFSIDLANKLLWCVIMLEFAKKMDNFCPTNFIKIFEWTVLNYALFKWYHLSWKSTVDTV